MNAYDELYDEDIPERDEQDDERYVVTFSREAIVGPGAVDGLRRMTLADARSLVGYAARIPKHGRVIDAHTLEVI